MWTVSNLQRQSNLDRPAPPPAALRTILARRELKRGDTLYRSGDAGPAVYRVEAGLLKLFLDRYDTNGLAGLTAIPIHTGGGLTHAMGPTFTLAPLLMELGAAIPGRGLYVPMSEFDTLEEFLREPVAEYAANIHRVSRLASSTQSAGTNAAKEV